MPRSRLLLGLFALLLTACGPQRPEPPPATPVTAPADGTLSQRPQWPLEVLAGSLKIPAGRLHGLWPGMILAITTSAYAPDGDPLGYARISEAGLFESRAEAITHHGKPALRARLIPLEAQLRSPALRLPVPLKIAIQDPESLEGGRLAVQLNRLRDDPANGLSLQRVDSNQPADLLLVADYRRIWLARPGETLVKQGPLAPPFVQRQAESTATEQALADRLYRIGQTRLLLAAAALGPEGNSEDQKIAFRLTRAKAKEVPGDGSTRFKNGDTIGFLTVNDSQRPIDSTLLLTDSSYQIVALYPPKPGAPNRTTPGKNLYIESEVDTTELAGPEAAILITRRGKSRQPYQDFTALTDGFLAPDQSRIPHVSLHLLRWRSIPPQ